MNKTILALLFTGAAFIVGGYLISKIFEDKTHKSNDEDDNSIKINIDATPVETEESAEEPTKKTEDSKTE